MANQLRLFDLQTADDFEAFWSVWPKNRKVGKKDARKAFAKALKLPGITTDFLIDRARAYDRITEHRERRFVLHPTTWLNGERWNDEVIDDGPDDKKGAQRQDRIRRYYESTQGIPPRSE